MQPAYIMCKTMTDQYLLNTNIDLVVTADFAQGKRTTI